MKRKMKKLWQTIRKLGPVSIVSYLAWLAIFGVTASYAFEGHFEATRQSIRYETDSTSLETAQRFQQYLFWVESELKCAICTVEEKIQDGCSPEEIQEYFERHTEEVNRSEEANRYYKGEDYIFYAVINGQAFDGSDWVVGNMDLAESRSWYQKALDAEGATAYLAPYGDLRDGRSVVTLSRSMRGKEDVIALDINVELFHQLAIQTTEGDEDTTIIVLDEKGTVIAHSDRGLIGSNFSEEVNTLNAEIYHTWKERYQGTPLWFSYDGHDYMFGAYSINDEWTAITVIDSDVVIGNMFRFARNALALGIIGSILIFVTIVFMASRKLKVDELYENLMTLSRSYLSTYEINLEFDTFHTINGNKRIRDVVGTDESHANEKMKKVMTVFSAEQSREEILAFVDLTTLADRIGDQDSMTIEFLGDQMHWMRGRFVVAERDEHGKARNVIWTVRSIDKEKRERERLQYLADTDKLTGILNRGSGEAKIAEEIGIHEGIFILLDVDKFKSINDTYGHRTGDKVLIAVANCVKSSFREDDVVMRLGGDEFVAFARGVQTKEMAEQILRRLFAKVDAISIPGLEQMKVHISVGVTYSNPDDKPLFKEVYKRADAGTYESKKIEGNQATFDETFPEA